MDYMPFIKSKGIKVEINVPINKTLKFWEGLKQGKIFATKCKNCGKIYFPPVIDCHICLSSDISWIKLGNEAEIETYTHVVVRPASFQEKKPYTIAIGKLKEGIKILAWLTGCKVSQIKIGMKVKLVTKISEDGDGTYEFIPLNN